MNANAQYIKDAQGNDIFIEAYNEWRFEKADLNNTQEITDWQKEILDESLRELELTGEAEDWDVLKFKIKQQFY